jgi:hypothetical protein
VQGDPSAANVTRLFNSANDIVGGTYTDADYLDINPQNTYMIE